MRNHLQYLMYDDGSLNQLGHRIFYQTSCVFTMLALIPKFQQMSLLLNIFARCSYVFSCNIASQPRCYQIRWQMTFWTMPRQSTAMQFHLVRHRSGFYKVWDKVPRIGEAQNPGPTCNTKYMPDHVNIPDDAINIGVVNPTGLIFKHESIATLGPGIWSVAESRVTKKGQQTLRREFKKLQFHTAFSKPVPTLGKNSGNYYQGIASGVACITQLPLMKTLFDIPQSILESSRFLATHISLGPHATLLVITIYAPPPTSHSIQDPQTLTESMLKCANRLVRSWNGPAIIQGDFNQDISANADIAELFTVGWVEAHDISVRVHQHSKQPTCITANGGVSHNTKILCNPIVANSIVYCNAWDDFLFATHPTLVLTCNLNTISRPHAVWKLPKPFTCHNFDREVAEDFQPHPNFSNQFREAITQCDVQQAADLWTTQAEVVLANSARDQAGRTVMFPQSHFGRNKGPKIINSPLSTPVLKPARQDEPNPNFAQGPTRYRQHLRQYRRLHTLVGLYRARQKNPTTQNIKACDDLWKAIQEASGFHKHGFPKWVCDHLSIPYSYHLPTIEVVIVLRDKFGEHFHTFTQKVREDFKQQVDNTFQQDWDKGGALTFAALRETGPQPSCYVGKTSQTTVKRIRWTKLGIQVLPCCDTRTFQTGSPVSFQGQTAMVTNVNHEFNTLTVDRPFVLKSQDFTITQKICIFDNHLATQEVTTQWNKFLQRDAGLTSEDWPEADRIAAEIPQQPLMNVPPFEPELWRRVHKSTNIKSARGSCGFTVAETRAFPTWVLLLLFQVYELIEAQAKWPDSWVCAFTVMLPKTSEPNSALDFRPITVLSRLYRMWARYKSISLLLQMSQRIPNLIAGGTKGMSALLLNAHFQETMSDQPQSSGLTVDIMKCYNCIPRYPLIAFMARLGWPPTLIRTYLAALTALKRSFLVLGHCSTWQYSHTGIPEGCALAVASMLTINAALYYFLQNRVPETILFTFADNWALKFLTIPGAFTSAQALESFCAALALQLSVPKSWTWATTKAVASQLQALQLQGSTVPNIRHTKDLGVDVTYRGKQNKTHLRHRLQLGLIRCTKIQKSNIPKSRSARLLQCSCYPKAAYGIELSKSDCSTFNRFRTNAKKSMGYTKQGSSPWIILSLLGNQLDFEHYTVKRTILFWRKYLQTFPTRVQEVFKKIAINEKGPLSGIIACFNKLGNVTPLGYWYTPHFGIVNWLTASQKWLCYIINFEWKFFACKQLQGRQHFHASMVDSDSFLKNVAKFTPEEQAIIKNHAGGTQYTHDAKSHFDLNTPDLCPFCKQDRDTRSHRILHCPILAPCRAHFNQKVWGELRDNATLRHFGLLPMAPPMCNIRQNFNNPWPNLRIQFRRKLHVFTDGSCYHNEYRHFAIAGAAAVVFEDVNIDAPIFSQRFLLPTQDHTSFRAEIFATFLAVQICTTPTIYTDCQAVFDEWQQILRIFRSGNRPQPSDHTDLWEPIIQTIQHTFQDIRVVKVKAHSNENDWVSKANAIADSEAKKVVTDDNSDLYSSLNTQVNRYLERRLIQHQVMEFQVQAAIFEFNLQLKHDETTVQETRNQAQQMAEPHEPLYQVPNDITYAQCSRCIYNADFLFRLAQWASTLFWEQTPHHSTSYLELMLQLIYETRTYPPFVVAKYPDRAENNQKIWLLRDQHPCKDFQGYTCQDLLTAFIRTINWGQRRLNVHFFPDDFQPQVSSLHIFQYKGYTSGIRHRAKLNCAPQIQTFCREHLPFRVNLKFPPPHVTPHVAPAAP